MPTVNEAEETDALRPAERRERRKRCPHRSSRIKNVVAEDDPLALDVEIDLAPLKDGIAAAGEQIVAIERDIENAERKSDAFEPFDLRLHPARQNDPARADADEDNVLRSPLELDCLRGKTADDAGKGICVDDVLHISPLTMVSICSK